MNTKTVACLNSNPQNSVKKTVSQIFPKGVPLYKHIPYTGKMHRPLVYVQHLDGIVKSEHVV